MRLDIEVLRDELLAAAREARHHAYAPYSGYTVGAAVYTENGRIFTGANVENASYGLTICAERVAVFRAVSEGVRRIEAMAVVTRDGGTPCGACRQVLAEFASEDALVWCMSEESAVVEQYRLADLLPHVFRLLSQSSGDDELTLGGV
ncbi:MAG: cytidine deaminase [Armatimonadota bacterium]|nr:cytidine deaminase [bacterium]MDW8321413.1 cytidine deaminase [Armatimonadota bacterium]